MLQKINRQKQYVCTKAKQESKQGEKKVPQRCLTGLWHDANAVVEARHLTTIEVRGRPSRAGAAGLLLIAMIAAFCDEAKGEWIENKVQDPLS
jgi:hypothetical protein